MEMIHNSVMTRQETIREKFPYGNGTQYCHAGQETICEKFPIEMVHSVPMTDRKLFAKSFLWR